MNRSTVANRWNLELIEENYQRWSDDPTSVDATWQAFFEGPLPRLQTHFALLATPEGVAADQMRQGCLAVPGFPGRVLDVLQPSQARYFDPLAAALSQAQPGLSTRADLCSALGSGWPGTAASMASSWAAVLSRLQ